MASTLTISRSAQARCGCRANKRKEIPLGDLRRLAHRYSDREIRDECGPPRASTWNAWPASVSTFDQMAYPSCASGHDETITDPYCRSLSLGTDEPCAELAIRYLSLSVVRGEVWWHVFGREARPCSGSGVAQRDDRWSRWSREIRLMRSSACERSSGQANRSG
jgi:hypothetical protein